MDWLSSEAIYQAKHTEKLSYGLANSLIKPKPQFQVNTQHPLIQKLNADFEESKIICHEHLSGEVR